MTEKHRSETQATPLIESVGGLICELKKKKWLEKTRMHWSVWFRGQPKAGWDLRPGVYRDEFGYKNDEPTRLKAEQHLYQQFRIMSAGLRTGLELPEDIYFLQQHYRMPTRLLDWTTSALAALYFACCDNSNSNGEIFILDAEGFTSKREEGRKGIATSRRKEFCDAIKIIDKWGRASAFPNDIILVRPDTFDRRITLQRSCFTFHVPKQPVLPIDGRNVCKLQVLGKKKSRNQR